MSSKNDYKYKYLKYKQKYLQLGGTIPGVLDGVPPPDQSSPPPSSKRANPITPSSPLSPAPSSPASEARAARVARIQRRATEATPPIQTSSSSSSPQPTTIVNDEVTAIFSTSGDITGIENYDYLQITISGKIWYFDRELSSGTHGTVCRYKLNTTPDQYIAIKFGTYSNSLYNDIDVIEHIGDALCEMVKSKVLNIQQQGSTETKRKLILMKYMDGGSIGDHTITSIGQVHALFKYLLTTCKCIAEKGFYYTDMKPGNILCNLPFGTDFALGDLGGATQNNYWNETTDIVPTTYPYYKRYVTETTTHNKIISGFNLKSPPNINDVFYGIGLVILACMYSLILTINIYNAVTQVVTSKHENNVVVVLSHNAKQDVTLTQLHKFINDHIDIITKQIDVMNGKDKNVDKNVAMNIINSIKQCLLKNNLIPPFNNILDLLK